MRKGPLPVFIGETEADARLAAQDFVGLSFYAMSWNDPATFEMLQGGHRSCYVAMPNPEHIPLKVKQLFLLQPRMHILTYIRIIGQTLPSTSPV